MTTSSLPPSEKIRPRHHLPVTTVFGQPFSRTTPDKALDRCEELIRERKSRHVVTANVDFLAQAHRDSELREMLFDADEILCDGMPLVWASRFSRRSRLPERVTGSDLVPRLLERCAEKGYRVFFFGSDERTLQILKEKLKESNHDLNVAGAASPPMGQIDEWDNESYIEQIRNSRPDLLLVALGFPKQDLWIRQFARQTGVPLALGIGASLDFIAGKQVRSPRWMQKSGLEWLWRLGTDPKRLCRRYANDFAVLSRLLFTQLYWAAWKKTACGTRRQQRKRALLNGIRTRELEIQVLENGQPPRRIPAESDSPRAFVCDCGGLDRIDDDVVNTIVTTARKARQQGKPFAIFSPPPQLEKWLQLFGRDRLMPCFDSPLSLAHYLGLAPALAFPECEERMENFAANLRERARAEGKERIRIDFRRFESSAVNPNQLLLRCREIPEFRRRRLRLDRISPPSEDMLAILGII